MKKTRRTSAFLLAMTLPLLALALAQEAPPDPLEEHEGIRNYHRLRPDVATAGQPADEAWDDIKNAGFKTVINLRTPEEGSLEEEPKVEAEGLDYVNIPIGRDGFTTEKLDLFSEILGNAEAKPVLIHCASSNRVGAMWLLHRVLTDGADESTALAEAKKAGLTSEGLEKRALEFLEQKKVSK